MLKVAPTLIVEKIEPTMSFLVKRLGFTKAVDVPAEDGSLAFAMMVNGNVEIHLQSRASVAKDTPYLAGCQMPPSSFLYIDVEDVASLYEELKNADVILPLQKTFYGAQHFFIREPGGHVLGFSKNG